MTASTMENDVEKDPNGNAIERQPEQDRTPIPDSAESLRDRLMRALADSENTRRQAERRVEDARQYAITNLARDLLQIVDNLHRALEAGAQGANNGLLEGVAATDRMLTQILNRYGVAEIDALNKPFDPMQHEAVMETEVAGQPPGRVVQVLEDGYMVQDRLLRPARVVVARAPAPAADARQE
jgi:molecular chaperone GrpE